MQFAFNRSFLLYLRLDSTQFYVHTLQDELDVMHIHIYMYIIILLKLLVVNQFTLQDQPDAKSCHRPVICDDRSITGLLNFTEQSSTSVSFYFVILEIKIICTYLQTSNQNMFLHTRNYNRFVTELQEQNTNML